MRVTDGRGGSRSYCSGWHCRSIILQYQLRKREWVWKCKRGKRLWLEHVKVSLVCTCPLQHCATNKVFGKASLTRCKPGGHRADGGGGQLYTSQLRLEQTSTWHLSFDSCSNSFTRLRQNGPTVASVPSASHRDHPPTNSRYDTPSSSDQHVFPLLRLQSSHSFSDSSFARPDTATMLQ